MASTTLPLVRSTFLRINKLLRLACCWVFGSPSKHSSKGACAERLSQRAGDGYGWLLLSDSDYDLAERGESPYTVVPEFELPRRSLVRAHDRAKLSPPTPCLEMLSPTLVSVVEAPTSSEDCFTSLPIRPARRRRRSTTMVSPGRGSLPLTASRPRQPRNPHLERVKAIEPAPDVSPESNRSDCSSEISSSSSLSSLFDNSDGDSVATLDTEAEEETCVDGQAKPVSLTDYSVSDVVGMPEPGVDMRAVELGGDKVKPAFPSSTSSMLTALASPESSLPTKHENVVQLQTLEGPPIPFNIQVHLFIATSPDRPEPEVIKEPDIDPIDDWVKLVLTSPPPPQPPSPEQRQLDAELDEIEAMIDALGAQMRDWNAEMREVLNKGKHMLFEL